MLILYVLYNKTDNFIYIKYYIIKYVAWYVFACDFFFSFFRLTNWRICERVHITESNGINNFMCCIVSIKCNEVGRNDFFLYLFQEIFGNRNKNAFDVVFGEKIFNNSMKTLKWYDIACQYSSNV